MKRDIIRYKMLTEVSSHLTIVVNMSFSDITDIAKVYKRSMRIIIDSESLPEIRIYTYYRRVITNAII